jgi:hypothetical protein
VLVHPRLQIRTKNIHIETTKNNSDFLRFCHGTQATKIIQIFLDFTMVTRARVGSLPGRGVGEPAACAWRLSLTAFGNVVCNCNFVICTIKYTHTCALGTGFKLVFHIGRTYHMWVVFTLWLNALNN